MPELDGVETQKRLAEIAVTLPVIFLTGRGTIATCSEALKAGAVNFLEKPAEESVLCAAVEVALERNEESRQRLAEEREAQELLRRLTSRETEVFQLVARGFTSPEISEFLNISREMIKVHRSREMKKLEAASVPDLVMIAQLVGLD